MKKILFVCTGNTCRSSMAEAMFKKLLQDHDIQGVQCTSAGMAVFAPDRASAQAVEVMKQQGIDLSQHRARQVTGEMIGEADLILTMTSGHRDQLLRMYPDVANKVFTLKEFANHTDENCDIHRGAIDVSDPFGLSVPYYEQCSKEIYECLCKILEKIKKA